MRQGLVICCLAAWSRLIVRQGLVICCLAAWSRLIVRQGLVICCLAAWSRLIVRQGLVIFFVFTCIFANKKIQNKHKQIFYTLLTCGCSPEVRGGVSLRILLLQGLDGEAGTRDVAGEP